MLHHWNENILNIPNNETLLTFGSGFCNLAIIFKPDFNILFTETKRYIIDDYPEISREMNPVPNFLGTPHNIAISGTPPRG
jgi:hypothetical protein